MKKISCFLGGTILIVTAFGMNACAQKVTAQGFPTSKGTRWEGGALKNMSIGYASPKGKTWIHSGSKSTTQLWGQDQDNFLRSMAALDGRSLIQRIESRNGILTMNHAARIGLGSLNYELVKL
jgi:uncharacterized Fe-S center protein